jgi:5-methyltetrahydrofolate--homocysteine methyltransferase
MAAPAGPQGLGIPRSSRNDNAQRFTSRNRGKRYSFGYPECSNLEDQAGISCCGPEEIGIQLTEDFMMDGEASVSALEFQRPDCAHFSIGDGGDDI